MKKTIRVGLVLALLAGTAVSGYALGNIKWAGSQLVEDSTKQRADIRALFANKNTTIQELREAGIDYDKMLAEKDVYIKELEDDAKLDAAQLEAYYKDITERNDIIIELNTRVDDLSESLKVNNEELAQLKAQATKDQELINQLERIIEKTDSELLQAYADVKFNNEDLKAIINENK